MFIHHLKYFVKCLFKSSVYFFGLLFLMFVIDLEELYIFLIQTFCLIRVVKPFYQAVFCLFIFLTVFLEEQKTMLKNKNKNKVLEELKKKKYRQLTS